MTKQKTRREFLNDATGLTAATLLGTRAFAAVHAGGDDTIQVALVGCGGRGSGAAINALSVARGPVRLVAMADVFEDRLKSSHEALTGEVDAGLDVPQDRRFIGFDAYKHAMDCLRPGDIVILATPPAFRWVHFTYAIEKGLNVFMEKPVTVDGPSTRRMLELAKKSREKGLKVGVGLMSRHSRAFQELAQRTQDGQLGEITSLHGYRMHGNVASFRSPPKPADIPELEYQIRRFHSFLWASGGCFNDFYIHVIDHLCWMKGSWPEKAMGIGGRHFRYGANGVPWVDQNFDSYGIEYEFADGTVMRFDGRTMDGADNRFMSYMQGTKGAAIVSANSDCGLPSKIFSNRDMSPGSLVWTSKVAEREQNPYQNEWEDLIGAVRDGKDYNEVERGARASLVCNMGRMSAHTGRTITFDEMLNCKHEFAPGVADLTSASPAPVLADAEGIYPLPRPGIVTDREY